MGKHTSGLLVTAILLAMSLFSCKEEENVVGRGLQINADSLFVDTLSEVTLYAVAEDSLVSSHVTSSLLGEVDDPLFGTVRSDIFAQFRLSANAIDFGEAPVLDSVILSLSYAGFFGDTLQSVRLGVYELSDALHKDSIYYTHQTLQTLSDNLVEGGAQFAFHPKTPAVVDGETMEAQLRIPLRKDFFTDRLLTKSGSPELENNAHFLEYFKGIAIRTEGKSGSGCLAYIRMLSNVTAITLYYHNNDHDSLSFSLVSNDSTNFFSHVDHQYGSAADDLKAQVLQNDYSSSGEAAFLQAGAGIKARLAIPGLSRYEGKKIAVHKAELILSRAEADGYNPFFAPAALTMYYKKDTNVSTS